MKTWLIARVDNLKKDTINKFASLPYTKIFLLFVWEWCIVPQSIPSKISVKCCENLVDMNSEITKTMDNNPWIKFAPYLTWEQNVKYALKIYNKTFWTNIDYKIFREKDHMMNFLWEIAHKKFLRSEYKDLMSKKYLELKKIVWETFIIKPTNAWSSVSTFKIRNEEDFESIKPKIAKSYEYITEEYIDWELFSLDFFMDWEKMFLLSYAREIPMIELKEKEKFHKDFLEKYWEEIWKHFNFHLSVVYPLWFEKIWKDEQKFIEEIRKKLVEIKYRWVIHLEYKHDKKNNKVWFIEWWARYWWSRRRYIKKMYHTDTMKLDQLLLFDKDYWKFEKYKWEIYKFKEREFNLNFAKIRTNFIWTKNFIDILKKTWNIMWISFKKFIEIYIKENFWINIKNIEFEIKHTKDFNFYPFYKNNKTKFDYIMELDNDNFNLFRKKKFQIIEKTIFHDYE